jgi:signal transduction histidine kinase
VCLTDDGDAKRRVPPAERGLPLAGLRSAAARPCGQPHPHLRPASSTRPPGSANIGVMPGQRHLIAPLLVGVAGVLTVIPLVLLTEAPTQSSFYALAFTTTFVAGTVAVRLQPANIAARGLLVFGAAAVFWTSLNVALVHAYYHGHATEWWFIAGNTLALLLDGAVGALMLALLAVYPDGRDRRPFERRVVRVACGLAAAVPALLLFAGDHVQPALIFGWAHAELRTDNPLSVGALGWLHGPLATYAAATLTVAPFAGALLAVGRYRRLPATRRDQLAWPFAGTLLLALSALTDPLNNRGWLPAPSYDIVEIGSLIIAPVLFAIGIVRPALFDIRQVLQRSLLYGALWAAAAVAYLGVAAAVGVAAGSGGVQLAVLAAIAVTLLIQPLWRRLARRAAQSVYGERLGGAELLQRIGSALEHTLDLQELTASIAVTVREGLGVAWVRIELDGDTVARDGAADVSATADPTYTAAIADSGRDLGRIACGPRPGGRLSRSDRELLETLGRQVALAIRNARLAGELAARLEQIEQQARELSASRSRIVEAQERGRRQIERDIHDGVQQELVALIARIGLARTQLARDPGQLEATLSDLQWEARQALSDLRELASGIHPSVLSDRGIVEAIESRASRLPLGVTIECERTLRGTRYAETVEGAAYFLVCEGFANALKHSGAERVTVRLADEGDALSVEVSDDGRGFDAGGRRRHGSGLDGLADRIDALGGTFTVTARPDHGTSIAARLPVHEHAAA